jgi:hypothetical protein
VGEDEVAVDRPWEQVVDERADADLPPIELRTDVVVASTS